MDFCDYFFLVFHPTVAFWMLSKHRLSLFLSSGEEQGGHKKSIEDLEYELENARETKNFAMTKVVELNEKLDQLTQQSEREAAEFTRKVWILECVLDARVDRGARP